MVLHSLSLLKQYGGMDIFTWDRHIWRPGVSSREKNVSLAEKGRPEQRNLWLEAEPPSRTPPSWGRVLLLFLLFLCPWGLVLVGKQHEYHFLLGDTILWKCYYLKVILLSNNLKESCLQSHQVEETTWIDSNGREIKFQVKSSVCSLKLRYI